MIRIKIYCNGKKQKAAEIQASIAAQAIYLHIILQQII